MFRFYRSQLIPALVTITLLAIIVPSAPAHAYIGPAMGLGMLGAGVGVLMTSASAIFYLFALSVRRAFRRLVGFVMRTDIPAAEESSDHRSAE